MLELHKINEDEILDSFKLQDHLSEDIFKKDGEEYVLRKNVKNALLKIASTFIEFLKIEFFVHDVILTGSIANYNWSNYSDIDLHIVIDFEEADYDVKLLKEFFDTKKVVWNSSHEIEIKGYSVELYVQDLHEKHESTGVYSVLNNKWIRTPRQENFHINKNKIKEKVDLWMDIIDKLVKQKDDADILDKIERVRQKLKKFRQAGLDKGGEYSYENLAFKYLRRNDYIQKLIDLKTEIQDKELTLKESINIYNKN